MEGFSGRGRMMMPVLDVVVVTTLAITQAIASIGGQDWLHGYTDNGLLVAIVSPWRVCALSHPETNLTDPVTQMSCFSMKSWTGTGFGPLEVIQQLEYWSLGAQVVAVLTTLVLSCNQAYHKCYLKLKRPSLIFQALACVLSLISISVFPVAGKSGLLSLTGQPTEGVLGWTYWLRLSACVTSFMAFLCGSMLIKFSISHVEPVDEEAVTFVESGDGEDITSDQQPMMSGSDL